MKREDWFWLTIKVSGLFLLVRGTCMLPELVATMVTMRPDADPVWFPLLEVFVPIIVGCIVLL
jgi:hypothetical protein